MTPTEPRGAEHSTLIEQAKQHTPCCQNVSDPCTSPACFVCGETWPCLVSSLAAEVARSTEALEAAEAWMTHVLGILSGEGPLSGRIPSAECRKDGRAIVDLARAALDTKGVGDGD